MVVRRRDSCIIMLVAAVVGCERFDLKNAPVDKITPLSVIVRCPTGKFLVCMPGMISVGHFLCLGGQLET